MSPTPERDWFIVSRWREYEGEGRANLLRVVALVAYYAVQLYQFFALAPADEAAREAAAQFQRQTTLVVGAWSIVALAVLICLQRRMFPAVVKYASTAADLVLLTLLAHLARGPQSPLVHVYFLIIGLAALRFSLGLVWCATFGSMAGYLTLVALADSTWFDADHTTGVVEQLVMHCTLALSGLAAGQVVRAVRSIAWEYAARRESSGAGGTP